MTLLHQAAQKAVEALTTANGILERRGFFTDKIPDAVAALESALQQQPEPVAPFWYAVVSDEAPIINKAIRRADVAEEYAQNCRENGYRRVQVVPLYTAPPALQHQEVPREPVARPSMSMYASAADYSAAMDGWIATTRQCPACKGKFGVDGQACDLCNATGRALSTTRQQEDGNV